MKGGK